MSRVRKLPIGIQDFKKLRTKNYIYIDKTDHLFKLTSTGCYYFLSRPRRFGKSLMLSTLRSYFLGEKKLFKDLKIAKLEKKWKKHPVFYIDFIDVSKQGQVDKNLYTRLDQLLATFEKEWGTDAISNADYSFRFERVIQSAVNKTGKKVVILVDEYDKPILASMKDADTNKKVKDILKSFYSMFKKNDANLRFVMLTGFSMLDELFSDLNNFENITFDNQFFSICGITEKELLTNFDSEFKSIAKSKNCSLKGLLSKMHELYSGYRFSPNGKSVFNPFSILNCLKVHEFKYYWFRAGTPTFLIEEMRKTTSSAYNLISNIRTTEDSLISYRSNNGNIIPLLYQSGYLTIKSVENDVYLLGFPNKEVEHGFYYSLLDYL